MWKWVCTSRGRGKDRGSLANGPGLPRMGKPGTWGKMKGREDYQISACNVRTPTHHRADDPRQYSVQSSG